MTLKNFFDWRNSYKSHRYVDYSAIAMFEGSSLAIAGLDTMQLAVAGIPPATTLTWSGLTITSTLTGKTITVSGSGMAVNDGDILYLKNVDHPIENNVNMPLQASSPGNKAVRKFGNLFLGAVVNGSLVLRAAATSTSSATPSYTFLERSFIPIEWAEDGSAPPDAIAPVTAGNGTIQAREFGGLSGSTVHDVVIPWEVPEDIVVASDIKFTVLGVVTSATYIKSNEDVSFKLSGYSVGSRDSISGTFGTEVEVNLPATGYAQYARFKSNQSRTVTITNLASGELVFLHLERDTADANDNYAQPIGVYGIVLEWTRNAST
jgi:hypothetical protein